MSSAPASRNERSAPEILALARLDVGPNRFRWPARLAQRLGRLPDQHVAALAGVSVDTVIQERRRRGIPPYRRQRPPLQWTKAMLQLLGTDTDRAVAAELGIRKQDVFRKRRVLGIPSYAKGTFRPEGFHWSARALDLLGGASDSKVAHRLGVSRATVLLKRLELGIHACHRRRPPVRWSIQMLNLLGKVTDDEIHHRFGIGKNAVRRKREDLGIPPTHRARPVARTRDLLKILKLSNAEIRSRFRVSNSTVGTLRREFGIAAPNVRAFRWTRDRLARLGQEPDTVLGRSMGLSGAAVSFKRRALGIRAYRPKRRWTKAECKLLGCIPDAAIARQVSRSLVAVQLKRRLLGIPRLRRGVRGLHVRPGTAIGVRK
jgi:hypothetical protein